MGTFLYITKLQGAKGYYEVEFLSSIKLEQGNVIDLNDSIGNHEHYMVDHVVHMENENICVLRRMPPVIFVEYVRKNGRA